MSVTQWPAGEGPREKLLVRGRQALSDAEVLAIVLGTGSSGCNVVELSRRLLLQLGVGPAKYAKLQASIELARRLSLEALQRGAVISSPEHTRQFLSSHLGVVGRETFSCLFLDSQHALIRCEDLFLGTLDGAAVYPREVVRRALELRSAAVIFAHNHPSGVAEPSQADRRITERLQAALGLVDIRVLDHVIVGRGQQYSFAEAGLL